MKFPDAQGAVAWGAGPLGRFQLDLTYYAIHVVELLYSVLGPGCQEVTRTHTDGADVIVGKWKGGKTGEARALRPDSNTASWSSEPAGRRRWRRRSSDGYRPLVGGSSNSSRRNNRRCRTRSRWK